MHHAVFSSSRDEFIPAKASNFLVGNAMLVFITPISHTLNSHVL
jgi:hypothetical protein